MKMCSHIRGLWRETQTALFLRVSTVDSLLVSIHPLSIHFKNVAQVGGRVCVRACARVCEVNMCIGGACSWRFRALRILALSWTVNLAYVNFQWVFLFFISILFHQTAPHMNTDGGVELQDKTQQHLYVTYQVYRLLFCCNVYFSAATSILNPL